MGGLLSDPPSPAGLPRALLLRISIHATPLHAGVGESMVEAAQKLQAEHLTGAGHMWHGERQSRQVRCVMELNTKLARPSPLRHLRCIPAFLVKHLLHGVFGRRALLHWWTKAMPKHPGGDKAKLPPPRGVVPDRPNARRLTTLPCLPAAGQSCPYNASDSITHSPCTYKLVYCLPIVAPLPAC